MNLSQNMQDYLKAIYQSGTDGSATTTDIAARLGVSPASVTSMMKKLAELRLVEHRSYHGVRLTHAGRKIALEVLRHHRLIETYLAEALGFDWTEVHDEAERLEHHISEAFEDRIAELLGDPHYDPHGDPIPTKDGKVPPTPTDQLADTDVGDNVVVRRVNSHDASILRLLSSAGIGIGSALRVMARDDVGNTITVRHQRTNVDLSLVICRHIFVER